ncbi:MAG: ELM1/GtrOC1 family putative glycosyltransferase [Pikeienuella sp.]
MSADAAEVDKKGPIVWALTTGRVGDDSQVLVAAKAAGGSIYTKDLRFNLWRELPNAMLGPSLRSLTSSTGLSEPWPDLVVGAGRRSVAAAMWIKQQSGGKSRLLRLGRPRAPLDWFDLILTTPQYGLPSAPNVLRMSLPLSEPPKTEPNGRDAVFAVLGGDSWTCKVTPELAQAFAQRATDLALSLKAPLKVATSPRTPAMAALALADALPEAAEVNLWRTGQTGQYQAWMAQAKACLVTGDSASVMSDAIMTGSPVTVVTPPDARWLAYIRKLGGGPVRRWLETGGNNGLLAPPPNVDALSNHLIANGCAKKVERDVIVIDGAAALAKQEHAEANERIKALVVT